MRPPPSSSVRGLSRRFSAHPHPSSAASEVVSRAHAGRNAHLPEPRHENVFLGDLFAQRCLQRLMPAQVYAETVRPELARFADRAGSELWALGRECELNPPTLRQTDAWGRRVDDIETCAAWKRQKAVSAEEGLVAIAYERQLGEYSRLLQAMKLAIYGPVSGLYRVVQQNVTLISHFFAERQKPSMRRTLRLEL